MDGHCADQYVVLLVALEMVVVDAAEIREADFGAVVGGCIALHHRQFQLDLMAVACFFGFKVPLAGVSTAVRAPAKSDSAVG